MKNITQENQQGFTRIDLLSIIAVILILGLLGAQKMGAADSAAVGVTCTGNMRQLLRSLHLYTSDNGDFFPYMIDGSGPNWLNHTGNIAPDATNSAKLINPTFSMLAPYLNGNASIFRCPADLSTVTVGGQPVPRVRSVSMNQAVGTNPNSTGGRTATYGPWLDGAHSHTANQTYRTYARLADIVNPRPENLFVFLDEHPDSMNDSGFACIGPRLSGPYNWIDWPATYHNKAGGFGFADGHGEIHSWVGAGTLVSPPSAASAQPDLHWLATHVTAFVTEQA